MQKNDVKNPVDDDIVINIYCRKYISTSANSTLSVDKSIAIDSVQEILIKDSSYTDATALKNAMKGVYLYYELETPITKTIDGNEKVVEVAEDVIYSSDSDPDPWVYDFGYVDSKISALSRLSKDPVKLITVVKDHDNALSGVAKVLQDLKDRLDSLIPIEEANL